MREIKFAQTVIALRKEKKLTQEELASVLKISSQAVSKWETGASLPDLATLPLIADYFKVSIDYLFYGQDTAYDDIYAVNRKKVSQYEQMSKESYQEALKIFASAHKGIFHGMFGKELLSEIPFHISNENGVALLGGKGFGAIVTRDFFRTIDRQTIDFGVSMLKGLTGENCLSVAAAIVSMDDISFHELKEKLGLEEEKLRKALDQLIEAKLVHEKKSKHLSLGLTYEIDEMYHTCLCLLLSVIAMQQRSLKGIGCCMGKGDYPIVL